MTAYTVDPTATLFIVLNAASGKHDATEARATLQQVLAEAQRPHQLLLVEDSRRLGATAQRAVALAQACGGVVVAAGGDGTINAVAQVALHSGCAFGVIPQGTFNYFSRAHGIPLETAEAARVLLTARAHPVQVGLINDRVFLVNASLGLYPRLLEEREAYKQQYGRSRLVALVAGVATLMREHRQLRIRLEHSQTRDIRTPMLFVGNNRLQLEQIGIAEATALDRQQLAAITLRPTGTLAMLWLMLRGAFGRLGDADNVISFAFRHMTVRPSLRYGLQRVKVATDGEVAWLKTPIEFRALPNALHLLKPEPSP